MRNTYDGKLDQDVLFEDGDGGHEEHDGTGTSTTPEGEGGSPFEGCGWRASVYKDKKGRCEDDVSCCSVQRSSQGNAACHNRGFW